MTAPTEAQPPRRVRWMRVAFWCGLIIPVSGMLYGTRGLLPGAGLAVVALLTILGSVKYPDLITPWVSSLVFLAAFLGFSLVLKTMNGWGAVFFGAFILISNYTRSMRDRWEQQRPWWTS